MGEMSYVITNQVGPLSTRENLELFKIVDRKSTSSWSAQSLSLPTLGITQELVPTTPLSPVLSRLLPGSLFLPDVESFGSSPPLGPGPPPLPPAHSPKANHARLLESTCRCAGGSHGDRL